MKPIAWMRRWAFDKNEGTKGNRPKGWTLQPTSKDQILPDDVPLIAKPRTSADLIEVIGEWLGQDCNWGDFEKALDAIISPDEVSTVVVAIKHPCPSSPDGKHHVDCTMESGPNNCFHCEKPMPNGGVA